MFLLGVWEPFIYEDQERIKKKLKNLISAKSYVVQVAITFAIQYFFVPILERNA
jgi:hypothetical protein